MLIHLGTQSELQNWWILETYQVFSLHILLLYHSLYSLFWWTLLDKCLHLLPALLFSLSMVLLCLNECVLPEFICWNLSAQYDGIRRWGLWEVLTSWRWVLTNGIRVLIKNTPQSSLALSTIWEHDEKSVTQKRALVRSYWHPD